MTMILCSLSCTWVAIINSQFMLLTVLRHNMGMDANLVVALLDVKSMLNNLADHSNSSPKDNHLNTNVLYSVQ